MKSISPVSWKSIPAFAIPIILGIRSMAFADDPTPGELFEAAFGIDPSALGCTNSQVDISAFQANCFATNEWVVFFAESSEDLDNTLVPFALSNMVSGFVSSGFAEQSATPELTFWTAATRIAATSKPLFVLAEEWTVNSDSSGISFLHRTTPSNPPDRLMRLERNLMVSIETLTISNPFEPVSWIVALLQTPPSPGANRSIASDDPPSPASSPGTPAPKPIQAMRVFSSDSEAEDEPASPTP